MHSVIATFSMVKLMKVKPHRINYSRKRIHHKCNVENGKSVTRVTVRYPLVGPCDAKSTHGTVLPVHT